MKKLFYLMLATIMLSSCATGMYLPGKSHLGLNTNVVLSQANYRIVRNLEVTVEINNSNLKRVDVEKSAYAELLRQANLTGSQALANVVVEEVRRENGDFWTFLTGIVKYKQYVSAYASIIEFLDDSGNPIPSVTKYAQPTEEPIEQPTEEPIEQPTEEPTEQPTEEPTEQQPIKEQPQQTSSTHQIAEYQDVPLIHKQINNAQMSVTDERFQIRKYYNKLFSEIRSGRISCTDLDMFKIQYTVKQYIGTEIHNEGISALMHKLKDAKNTEEYQAIFIQEYDSLQ